MATGIVREDGAMQKGLLIGAVMAGIQEALRGLAFEHVGEGDCGSTPCWRSALVLVPQVAGMGLQCAIAAHCQAWSLNRWCDDCEKRGLTTAAHGVLFCFYAYLVADMLYWFFLPSEPVIMRDLMVTHHVVCIFGTLYATTGFCSKASMPAFVAAITMLELGSSFSNVYYLYRFSDQPSVVRIFKQLYFFGMGASNLGAAACTVPWFLRERQAGVALWRRLLPMGIWFALMGMRQEAAQRLAGPSTW